MQVKEKAERYGPGPWIEEDDRREWADEVTGLDCLILRNDPTGALCGYVRVSDGHPLYGKSHKDEVTIPEGFRHREFDDRMPAIEVMFQVMSEGFAPGAKMRLALALECHGGVTYSGPIMKMKCSSWWFGFDCGHYADLKPGTRKFLAGYGIKSFCEETYRDMRYVAKECATLAMSLTAFNVKEPDRA